MDRFASPQSECVKTMLDLYDVSRVFRLLHRKDMLPPAY
jgi:hypothetical protein